MNKILTVDQYKFYKTKHKPLSDVAIMEIHGLNNVAMNTWKKNNNLIGVKFEPAATPNPEWKKRQKSEEEENPVEEMKAPLVEEGKEVVADTQSVKMIHVQESLWAQLKANLQEYKDKQYTSEQNLAQYKEFEQKYINAQREIQQIKKELKQQDRLLEGNYDDDRFLAHLMKKYIRELEARLEG